MNAETTFPIERHAKKPKVFLALPKDPDERIAVNDLTRRARKALRKARVAVTYKRSTRAERVGEQEARRLAKYARRQHQELGFFPVANAKVTTFYQQQLAIQTALGLKPADAHDVAWRATCRRLPAGRMCKGAPKPSKSDNPAYRRPNFSKAARKALWSGAA